MKIVICGRIGSGKSTTAQRIAKELDLKHYSDGDMMRALAIEKGVKLETFVKQRSDAVDKMIDEKTMMIGKKEDNFIFDSRLAFHFIPDAIKIFLEVSEEVGSERIFKHQRKSEAPVKTAKELLKKNKERWETDRQRFKKLYGVDINDIKNYDIVIDTTILDVEGTVHEIKRALRALPKK